MRRFFLILLAMVTISSAAMMPLQAKNFSALRARENFNADWRFQLGDVAGAEAAAFDDHPWQRVGLPHSFGIPYFQNPKFYIGYGWYRKHFAVPEKAERLSLEFEGAFQEAEIFVNGIAVGHHRGGYTGFAVDITKAAKPGDNVVAVRVNNKWDPILAPRGGEHVFQGGLYRNVWLVTTKPVHVTWYGTKLTTPEVSGKSGTVALETEISNDGAKPVQVTVRTDILDPAGRRAATLPAASSQIAAGATAVVGQGSQPIAKPALWSPETPQMYRAVTTVLADGRVMDRYETPFGFRSIAWTADRGFFLNGQHRYFKGANVHQDQAGWGDAVTDSAMGRDVQMMKDAGFDFIRGSHYPHSPHFVDATDNKGILFWSELSFWGTGGFGPSANWLSSAYPVDPAHKAAFEACVKQQLTDMIRIFRNHPSVIAWSMGNETFFSDKAVMPDVRRFLGELVALTHQLDPTRPAAIGGVQRGEIDHIGDIAGYNGDGAWMFPNPGIANVVSEYGSTMEDRPGSYAPGWGDLAKVPEADKISPYPWRYPWRSGEAVWAGFDHGSIAGRKFGSMGLVDYARLPKRAYYWYRNEYRQIPPPAWPKPGIPAALRLSATSPTIARADGTDDVQLVVTVVDDKSTALSNSPPVTLTIESGPGELPTGRSIRFAPDSDIPIRDGQAAIAMRSWQAGSSVIRASSPGLKAATLTIKTAKGPRFAPGVTPLAENRPYLESRDSTAAPAPDSEFGLNNPTDASSSAAGHSSRLVNDGNPLTYWAPAYGDKDPWVVVDPERILQFRKLIISFPQAGAYHFRAEVKDDGGVWRVVADDSTSGDSTQQRVVEIKPITGSQLRLKLTAPPGMPAGIAEIRIVGAL